MQPKTFLNIPQNEQNTGGAPVKTIIDANKRHLNSKNLNFRELLRTQLPRVNASESFINSLQNRIKQAKSE